MQNQIKFDNEQVAKEIETVVAELLNYGYFQFDRFDNKDGGFDLVIQVPDYHHVPHGHLVEFDIRQPKQPVDYIEAMHKFIDIVKCLRSEDAELLFYTVPRIMRT